MAAASTFDAEGIHGRGFLVKPLSDNPTALFVYGSLLSPECRVQMIGREVIASPASLRGWRVRSGRYFYVVPDKGAVTMGLILRGLTPDEFEALDRYEDAPRLYTRELVTVTGEHGEAEYVWIYMSTPLAMSRE
jgi:gamma-glutamylcyclotransferase (GGCT)/AIG2-like uncharacterized protein YtfP